MKKLIFVCLAALLVLGLSVTVFASGETVSVTVSGEADPGSNITVVVAVSGCDPVKSCQVDMKFDPSAFQIVDSEWLISGTEGEKGMEWDQPTDINKKIARLTLKVKEGAAPKQYEIGCTVTVTSANGGIMGIDNVKKVQVCIHDFTKKAALDYLIEPASCAAPASYRVSCKNCGKVGTEIFTDGEPLEHTFDKEVEEPEYLTPDGAGDCQTTQVFYKSCVCGEKGTETFKGKKYGDHVYENACDTECDVCGRYQEPQHTIGEDWVSNSKEHWHKCETCGEKLDAAAHEPGAAEDDPKKQICQICDYIIDAGIGEHIHQYGGDWRMDEEYHWYQCECGNIAEKSGHEWVRGEVLQEATEDETGLIEYACRECGKKKVEEIPATGGEDEKDPTIPTQPIVVEEEGDGPNVLAIVLGVFLILSLCGNAILTYLLVASNDRRKRRR